MAKDRTDHAVPFRYYEAELRCQREHAQEVKELHRRLDEERDRRISEVRKADQEAIATKDQGDQRALELAREIQVYRDEKSDRERERINKESLLYVNRDQLDSSVRELKSAIDSVQDTVTRFSARLDRTEGEGEGSNAARTRIAAAQNQRITIIGIVLTVIFIFSTIVEAYVSLHH
jgi:chromosome segregation ATPase